MSGTHNKVVTAFICWMLSFSISLQNVCCVLVDVIPCIFTALTAVLLSFFVGKDKSQAKARLSKAQSQGQDSDTEKQEMHYLMECKTYLCSIFVHWEPLIPVSEPQLVNSQHSSLASDAAHLLSKWCLRCLVEESYDENRTKEFLFWAKKTILEHKEIMNVVLDDSGWRADLLRLHHCTEVYCHSSIPSRVETFQIFTDIMMCLLEAKGNLPLLHQAVKSACLSKSRYGESLPSSHFNSRIQLLFYILVYMMLLFSPFQKWDCFCCHSMSVRCGVEPPQLRCFCLMSVWWPNLKDRKTPSRQVKQPSRPFVMTSAAA